MSLLRWSGLTPPLSDELDVINGGGGSDSELGSGQLLLEDALGGPGLEASPSVSASGGAHWPKRHAMIGFAKAREHLINVRNFGGAVQAPIRSKELLKKFAPLLRSRVGWLTKHLVNEVVSDCAVESCCVGNLMCDFGSVLRRMPL